MATFLELRNLTAYWLDDLNMTYFTPTQINRWLNNAQTETQKILLQAHNNFYVTPVQTTLVVNQNDYVLPIDFLTLHRLEIVLTGSPPNEDCMPVAPVTLNQQDLVPARTGTPQFYFLKKNRIRVLPAPDTALTLRMHYSYLVSDMVLDTDSPDVPPAYHELISVLAALDGLLKDGRNPELMLSKREYYEALLREEVQDRAEDAPRGIISTGNSGGGGEMFGYF